MSFKKIFESDYNDLNGDPLTPVLLAILIGTILAQIILWILGL